MNIQRKNSAHHFRMQSEPGSDVFPDPLPITTRTSFYSERDNRVYREYRKRRVDLEKIRLQLFQATLGVEIRMAQL